MHYSKHRLTASVSTWQRARTRQPMTSGLALLDHWSIRRKTKPCQFSSVQFSYVALYALLSRICALLQETQISEKKTTAPSNVMKRSFMCRAV